MAKIRPPLLVLRNREVVEVNPRKEIDVGLRKFNGYSVFREYDGNKQIHVANLRPRFLVKRAPNTIRDYALRDEPD
jgi:hypothetical protein